MSEPSTTPVKLERLRSGAVSAAKGGFDTSSGYIAQNQSLVAQYRDMPNGDEPRPVPNQKAGESTRAPQVVRMPSMTPVAAPAPRQGRRRLRPLYEWEGVVEKVTDEGFEARLVPLDPEAARGTVEFTSFAFDDLATDSDVALVDEGAVFYWTVGKGRNSAGTQSNVSLVRFRRLPPSSRLHQARAEEEATELLEELGDAS